MVSCQRRILSTHVDAAGDVRVLNEDVGREDGVVRLDDGLRNLGRREDGEGAEHAVGVLLTDLGDEEGTHTGTGTTTERVGNLEALEAVTALSLTADNVEDRVDELGTLSVVTLGPVVTGTRLTEDKVVGAEERAKGTATDRVHSSRLKVDEDRAGNVLASSRLIVVHVDALELNVRGALVRAVGLDAVLLGDDLPGVCERDPLALPGVRRTRLLTRTWHRSGYHTGRSGGGQSRALNESW